VRRGGGDEVKFVPLKVSITSMIIALLLASLLASMVFIWSGILSLRTEVEPLTETVRFTVDGKPYLNAEILRDEVTGREYLLLNKGFVHVRVIPLVGPVAEDE
jgi:hypothetical protein